MKRKEAWNIILFRQKEKANIFISEERKMSLFWGKIMETILHNLLSPGHKYLQCRLPGPTFSAKMADGNERECQIVNPVTRRKIQLAKLMGLFPFVRNLVVRSPII